MDLQEPESTKQAFRRGHRAYEQADQLAKLRGGRVVITDDYEDFARANRERRDR